MKKKTSLYLDGKKVMRKDCKIKGLGEKIRHLRSLCFLNDMSVSQSYKLSNGKKLNIIVSSKK